MGERYPQSLDLHIHYRCIVVVIGVIGVHVLTLDRQIRICQIIGTIGIVDAAVLWSRDRKTAEESIHDLPSNKAQNGKRSHSLCILGIHRWSCSIQVGEEGSEQSQRANLASLLKDNYTKKDECNLT